MAKKIEATATDIVVAPKTELSILGVTLSSDLASVARDTSWGAGADLEEDRDAFAGMIIRPKVRLQQGTRQNFKNVPPGMFLDSTSGSVFGAEVKFIVVSTTPMWRVFEIIIGQTRPKYIESFRRTKENSNLKWDFEQDGRKFRRRPGLITTCLLVSDLEKGIEKPYTIDYWGESSKVGGNDLMTYIDELTRNKYQSAAVIFQVSVGVGQNDGTDFYYKIVRPIGHVDPKWLEIAKNVYSFDKANQDKIVQDFVDGEDVQEVATGAAGVAPVTPDDIPF